MFPESRASTTTPQSDPEIAKQLTTEDITATSNWRSRVTWGGLAAGIAVVATVGIYYGGGPFIAALSSFGTGIMSLFGRIGQDTALTPMQHHTELTPVTDRSVGSELPIVWDAYTQEQMRRQERLELLATYSQTEEWEKYQEELGINDFEDEEDNLLQGEALLGVGVQGLLWGLIPSPLGDSLV